MLDGDTTGADAGADAGADTGADTGADAEVETGTSVETGTGAETVVETDGEAGVDSAIGTTAVEGVGDKGILLGFPLSLTDGLEVEEGSCTCTTVWFGEIKDGGFGASRVGPPIEGEIVATVSPWG